jgi:hypothetical protein
VSQLLHQPLRAASIGAAGRACVLAGYDWDARLSSIDHYLDVTAAQPVPA